MTHFLGAFMTVLRLERGTGVLIHAELADDDDGAIDLALDLPAPLTGAIAIAGQPDVLIQPGADPPALHITRRAQDLWADPRQRMADFRAWQYGRFEFLPIGAAELAHLRALIGGRWVLGVDASGPDITFVAGFPFLFDMGKVVLDLHAHMPRFLPREGGYVLNTQAGEITITRTGDARAQLQLRKRAPLWHPPRTASPAVFRAGGDVWLEIAGEEEFADLPITVCDADRDWMFEKPYAGEDPITGRHRCRPLVAHEADKYVLLSRFAEGVIFDEHGVCNEDGYLEGYGYRGAAPMIPPPAGMRCDHDRLFVDRAALAEAPAVQGDTIVFILGNLSNYTHWLIDGLLALHVLLEHTPPGARLLLPGTLHDLSKARTRVIDHYDTLRAFGFDHLPVVEIGASYCRLEHAYWLEGGAIFNMPGAHLRAFRARAARLRPPPARRDGRIYIARRRGRRIANAEMLAPFLERQGFMTCFMEDYSIDQQIDLFGRAEWVIGPHGAEFGNLLFCRPGTKVLEISPDYDFKPYFSDMCNKLGLTHGVLPSATNDGSFNGDIILDMRKFTALFRMLKNRLS